MDPLENYQEDSASEILSLVKKYPLYSVDKLAKELPNVSRRLIQKTLEKNNLSTLEERLAYAQVVSEEVEAKEVLKPVESKSPRIVKPNFKLPAVAWPAFKSKGLSIVVVVFGFLVLSQLWGYFNSVSPSITLDQPKFGEQNQGENLFVSGSVYPPGSKIWVNQEPVVVNGDGSFTAITQISEGESVLEIDSSYRRKKARLVRPVTRVLTSEELMAKEQEEAAKKSEAIDKVASLEKSVNDLLAAKNAANNQQKDTVKVLNSQLNQEAGFSNVAGEVINNGSAEVSWVMITVNFYDKGGTVVDTKFGFATDFKQTIKPGETGKFETQATNKPFDHYGLELSWQEGGVAGSSTQDSNKTASEAAKPSPKPSSNPQN